MGDSQTTNGQFGQLSTNFFDRVAEECARLDVQENHREIVAGWSHIVPIVQTALNNLGYSIVELHDAKELFDGKR